MSSYNLTLSAISNHIANMRALLLPYNQEVESYENELNGLLNSHDTPAVHVNKRIAEISARILKLKNNAIAQFNFVPEKLGLFCQSYEPFFQEWRWMMSDNAFQDPFHQFCAQVKNLSSKVNLTSGDYMQLKLCFSQLSLEDKQAVLHHLGLFQGSSLIISDNVDQTQFDDILTNEERFDEMPPARLGMLLDRLKTQYLPQKVALLTPNELELLKHQVEKKARDEGLVIPDWDRQWRDYHLYDSPDRLLAGLSQMTLMKRNETLFMLWKELREFGIGQNAFRLLMQTPLLEDVRRGIVLEIAPETVSELQMRAILLNRFYTVQKRLEQKFPSFKWAFMDPSHPISKGMNEKIMRVILSPTSLLNQGASASLAHPRSASQLASDLESYLSIVSEIASSDGMQEADAEYLFGVANNQYAMKLSEKTVQGELALLKLLDHAKSSLRSCQLLPEPGMVRVKEEQYQSIYLIREDNNILGKFKPLPSDTLKKEMLGESFDAILGTDFAPSASGVWLSLRNELLNIRSLLVEGKQEKAIKQFNLLDQKIQHEIYYQLYLLKQPVNPPSNYGEAAWHGAFDLSVSKEDRVEAIDRYLSPKRPLEIIRDCFVIGDVSQAMQRFKLLNFDLKHFIYYQLYMIKKPHNPPREYGEWAWHGHPDFPVSNEERKRAVELCLESDSFDHFILSRDPLYFHLKGTLQTWTQKCKDGAELLFQHPDAGVTMRKIPVSWMQMYNILGIIKGAGDCHPGNTLFQKNESGQVVNLVDCDDEFIMPDANHVGQIQIWTLGFPQASKPLLKPIVKMLAAPEFVDKWIKFIRSQYPDFSDPKVTAFESRIRRLNELCREELDKPSISLTCQDLYFEIYGGRQKFEQLKRDEGHRPEFVLFQYFMKDGMIQYLDEEAMRWHIFRANVEALYSSSS